MPAIRCLHIEASLKPKGVYVAIGTPVKAGGIGTLARLIQMLLLSRLTSQKLITFVAKPSKEDLTLLQEVMTAGRVIPVIDKRYSLSEVPEAIRYLEEGHACGKVVITLE